MPVLGQIQALGLLVMGMTRRASVASRWSLSASDGSWGLQERGESALWGVPMSHMGVAARSGAWTVPFRCPSDRSSHL